MADSGAEVVRATGMQAIPEARRGGTPGYSTLSGSPDGTIRNGLVGESTVDQIELPQA